MNLIEIFKAGTRKDANGTEVTITVADLKQAVESYNVEFHEAPAVIGHPEHNRPAYAWVKRLELEGDILKAELDQIDPEFAEMVDKGRFKKVSASFYLANSPNNPKQGSLYLRHVGFLGAMPPAVKGLRNPVFAEGEEGVVDFSDWAEASLWRRLRDWIIGKHGQDEADQVLPDYLVSSIQEDAVREGMKRIYQVPEPNPIFNEPKKPKGERQMSMTPEEIAAMQAENAQLKAEKAQAEAEKVAEKLEATKEDNASFCENLVTQGKLAPVAKDAALALLNCSATMASGQVVNFNEGESIHSLTKKFLEAQPQIVQFGEVATKEKAYDGEPDTVSYAEGTDPNSIEADQKIRAYAKEKGVSYTEAFNAIYK
ncbi:peptidase [Glaesserella parasuis]|uniref:peptidase n=1 Tax=Glaesserella parasuis TaxID=738 RepID=UPI001A94E1CF|nr:peptidase [Glaesserella parasuis]MDP0171073.1 peptidase [Glaesserella parasuis]QSX14325.1 peptidase [Glaesserella parasuis]